MKFNKIHVRHTCKSWMLQTAVLQPAPFNKNKPVSTSFHKCLSFMLLCYQYVPKLRTLGLKNETKAQVPKSELIK